ncbi:HD domain-containing protein [Listeria sp. PSOL-1]|uniref:HD domain-containing protein n=1 Tax=Listeria sp. PSOL-1 TaxID=1844999 RepID=UPI0013D2CA03|nr:HD domain-containing protein [Listeria sp. PSOL-1]
MYQKAKIFAANAHLGQKRKITGEKYFSHPLNVARLLANAGFSEEVVVAGLLHDVVEDTEITSQEIERQFGKPVAELVAAHTENKALSWEERKAHTIETVRLGSLAEKALIVADKYDNLLSIQYAFSSEGKRVWSYFKRSYSEQKWYYESVAKEMSFGLGVPEIPSFFFSYAQLVPIVFGENMIS